jgi:hypothetical protein
MSKEELQAIANFVLVARHVRNYPHPNVPIERLRGEAVIAEMEAERIFGSDVYQTVCELAFKES